MPAVVPIATMAATAYAANRQAGAARDAARAGTDAANAGRQDIEQAYSRFEANSQPYREAGANALGLQQRFLGGDYGHALSSPDYTARFSEGLRGLDRSAASRGGLHSGGHSADLLNYGGGMASQGLNDYWGRLSGLSEMGASMTSNLGSSGLSAASGMAHQGNLAGQARASGYAGRADAQSAGAVGLAGLFGNYARSTSWGNPYDPNAKQWGKG